MQHLIENYQRQHQNLALPTSANTWLNELKSHSLMQLGEIGFPTMRDENWRYTNIKPVLKQAFDVVTSAACTLSAQQLQRYQIEDFDSLRFVIVDGVLDVSLSAQKLPRGLNVFSLADVIAEQPEKAAKYINQLLPEQTHGFMELNGAFINNGVWIEADEQAVVEQAIELLFITTAADNAIVQPRNVFIANEQSKIKIVERFVSFDDHKIMTNTISEIYCQSNAVLEHIRIQQESRLTNHISGTFAKLQRQSMLSTSTISLGGNLTRNDLRCQIAGTGSHVNLYGLHAINGRQHVDNFTQVEHLVEKCTSDELYKGVLDDRSRAVFHGRIYVAQDAQQTDAYQNNRTLLLSGDAEIDTKPQLEIYADDVKCSHGATIGQLNEEYMFYFRSRGVSQDKARRMLTFAFVKEALNSITIEPLKAYLENQLDQQLQKGDHYGN